MSSIRVYLDENDYTKKSRSLRKYFMKTYKDMIFNVIPNIDTTKDGNYKADLLTFKDIKKIYGTFQLDYTVKDKVIIINNILPDDLLLEGYKRTLPVYKGIVYKDEKDKFKIDLVKGME